MRELPCLMNSEMVRATLAGAKTQTRRPVKPQPWLSDEFRRRGPLWIWRVNDPPFESLDDLLPFNPLGVPGDLLYVRETWIKVPDPDPELGGFEIRYRATDSVDAEWYGGWRPSIHMPKDFARLWLMVTDVRAERIQDITEEDAFAEGINTGAPYEYGEAVDCFRALWDSIYAKKSLGWDSNCWVWVTSYEVVKR